ncbi:hypothetical protein NEFER03_0537 [Nematocida sp. LUAm3]|nr:hypothetical protein NEFER03_0537 [Nematocida sp. LUAm3]KAI5175504.1 hypothetical protein NEFER02_1410 [Nematocida sp. LUAm2]KAI5178466.1 hypothetical protein NEFER01_1613 [Nematocida sp. LUAm1]
MQEAFLRERKESLPEKEEFLLLCKRLKEERAPEKIKISIAGRYFSAGKEKEYKMIRDMTFPNDEEERTVLNNQDILVNLILFSREHESEYLINAKKLKGKTLLYPITKCFLYLAEEEEIEEITKEGYKLNRKCKYASQIKALIFLRSSRYEDALSILEKLPETIETLFLKMKIYMLMHKPIEEIQNLHSKLVEHEKAHSPSKRVEEMRKHADRLLGKGVGVGVDKIVHEIEESLSKNTGSILTSTEELIRENAKNPERALRLAHNIKSFYAMLEMLRAETMYVKKRYQEALVLSKRIKEEYKGKYQEIDRKCKMILLLSHIQLKKTEEIDASWISFPEKEEGGAISLLEVVKMKGSLPLSLNPFSLQLIRKVLDLTETEYLWKLEINRSRYYNRMGNIFFAQRNIEEAKKKYKMALEIAEAGDREGIQENLDILSAWEKREETPLHEIPEALALLRDVKKKPSSYKEYIKAVTEIETPAKATEDLEDIVKLLSLQNSSECLVEAERIKNILSLCSFLKYKNPLLSNQEVSSSNISVIYNHILFCLKEEKELDEEIFESAVTHLASRCSTDIQKLLAEKAILIELCRICEKERKHDKELGSKINEKSRKKIASAIERIDKHVVSVDGKEEVKKLRLFLQETRHIEETSAQEEKKEEVSTPHMSKNEETPKEKEDSEKEDKTNPSSSQENDLSQKREEVMKALLEIQSKSTQKKKAKDNTEEEAAAPPVKRRRINKTTKQEEEKEEIPKKIQKEGIAEEQEEKRPLKEKKVSIKKHSKAVMSSEEE